MSCIVVERPVIEIIRPVGRAIDIAHEIGQEVNIVPTGPPGPPGPPGAVAPLLVLNEIPAGVVNGSNATFTTAFNFVPGQIAVRINGLSQRFALDFTTIGTTTILFSESPGIGDSLQVDYLRS